MSRYDSVAYLSAGDGVGLALVATLDNKIWQTISEWSLEQVWGWWPWVRRQGDGSQFGNDVHGNLSSPTLRRHRVAAFSGAGPVVHLSGWPLSIIWQMVTTTPAASSGGVQGALLSAYSPQI
jgi:hypothetical protein